MIDDKLNIDELIDIASNSGTSSDKAVITDVIHLEIRKFIRAKNINAGGNAVHARLIYDYYFEWSAAPMAYKTFVKYLSIYFTKVRSSDKVMFKIDPTCFGLPSYYSTYGDERFLAKKRLKNFIVRFTTEENTHYVGRFKTEKQAAAAYDKYAYLHFGLKTKLNFPENKDVYEKEIAQQAPKEKK